MLRSKATFFRMIPLMYHQMRSVCEVARVCRGKAPLSHAKYVVTISFALFKYVVKCLDLLKEPQDTPYRSPISIGFPIRKMNHIQQINDYAVFMHPFLSNSIVLKCVHVSSLNRNLRHLRNPCAPCPPRI